MAIWLLVGNKGLRLNYPVKDRIYIISKTISLPE